MNRDPLAIVATLVVRVYGLLLHLYPAQFKREYAPHMLQAFQDIVVQAIQKSGWTGLVHICGLITLDLIRSLSHEHYTALMKISPRTLSLISSFAAFYFAALPLWISFYNRSGMDYRPFFILSILPIFIGLPIIVLGISGRLLPRQKFTSVPYIIVSISVLAYIILMASRDFIDIEVVQSWGITNRTLHRIFWGGIALLGGMAVYQRERKLGGVLLGTAMLYYLMSILGDGGWSFLVFVAGLVGGFIYVGIWLYQSRSRPVTSTFTLSWWTIATQVLILVTGIGAIVTSSQRPLRSTDAYKIAAGFYPSEPVLAYDDYEAREEIEHFLGKSLPDDSHDLSIEYVPRKDGFHYMHIRFSASYENVRKLIRSGFLCFKADIDKIPVVDDEPIINNVLKRDWYQQRTNPWHASNSWRWARNPYHIKGYCPIPNRYGIEIYMHSPESWWVTISGFHR